MTATPATAPKSARVSAAPRAGRATDQFAKAMRRAERDTQAFKRKHHAQDSGNAFLDAFKKPNVHFVGLNAPYMDPEADVVLRSNDGVDFRVHSDALSGTRSVAVQLYLDTLRLVLAELAETRSALS